MGLRIVDPGNIVHAADAAGIVTITQLQPIAVLFNDSRGQTSGKSRKSSERALICQPMHITGDNSQKACFRNTRDPE